MKKKESPTDKKGSSSNSSPSSSSSSSSSPTTTEHSSNNNNHSPLVAAATGSPSLSSISSTVPTSSPPRSPSRPCALHLHPKQTTPQMMVLGKDGSDYLDLAKHSNNMNIKKSPSKKKGIDDSQEDKQQALLQEEFQDELVSTPTAAAASKQPRRKKLGNKSSKSWWKKGLSLFSSSQEHGDNNNNNNTNEPMGDEYASMEHSEAVAALPQHHSRSSYDEEEGPIYYHDMSEQQSGGRNNINNSPRHSSTVTMHRSLLRNLPLPATQEDQIQQDCSFLYRPVSADHQHTPQHPARTRSSPSRRSRKSLRAVLDPPPRGVSTLYRDAQDVLAPPAMANFQAKYQQLNQEFEWDCDHDRYEDYNDYAAPQDLILEDNAAAPPPRYLREPHTLVTDTTSQSCLFYQHETTGRVELRLPRDHVRLIVDPSMETGILSVLQCRNPDDPLTDRLEYCLTCPPDLYQRVVSEMTHYSNHWSTGGGLESSFYASEHVDIKVAVGALALVVFILGVQTLIWPVD